MTRKATLLYGAAGDGVAIGKAEQIAQQLQILYPETPVPLNHSDQFTLLIAVLLSAQCTDKKVNEVTPALFEVAPDPRAMAALPVETIQHHIRALGLAPTKARNIHALSLRLLHEFDGKVPQTFEDLESLPGVGHKTASVVMSQAFGIPAFPVDTHIFRLGRRWGLSVGHTVEAVEADLKRIYPAELWNRLHLQIIFFGREHCPAQRHLPSECPICSWAGVEVPPLPEKKPRKPK